ncbi:MAG: hypothetical protein WA634_02675 [Silvibacterium sp.]
MQVSHILSEIDREIECLQQARNLLAAKDRASTKRRQTLSMPKEARAAKKKAGKRPLNAKGRRGISAVSKTQRAVRKKPAK